MIPPVFSAIKFTKQIIFDLANQNSVTSSGVRLRFLEDLGARHFRYRLPINFEIKPPLATAKSSEFGCSACGIEPQIRRLQEI